MSEKTAPEVPTFAPGEVRNGSVSFANWLDSGETLSGTPTVAEVTTTDLTITNKAVSTAALTINDKSVALGQAVQFTFTGQLATRASYTIQITTVSSGSQTMIGYVTFQVATS